MLATTECYKDRFQNFQANTYGLYHSEETKKEHMEKKKDIYSHKFCSLGFFNVHINILNLKQSLNLMMPNLRCLKLELFICKPRHLVKSILQ